MDGHSFPANWTSYTLNGYTLMCAFSTSPAPFRLYVTDLVLVWADCPTTVSVYEKAASIGISDFDNSKLQYLVSKLESAFETPNSDALKISTNNSHLVLEISVAITSAMEWNFTMSKFSASDTAEFFANLCNLNFANHSFLLFKISVLERSIRANQNYSTFLQENYRSINGSELIDKYKRQHSEDTPFLQDYLPEKTSIDVSKEYASLLRQLSTRTSLWDRISLALSDTSTWLASAGLQTKLADSKTSPPVRVKREATDSLEVGTISHKKPKLDPISSSAKAERDNAAAETESQMSSPIKEPGSSPRRRRIGLLGRNR